MARVLKELEMKLLYELMKDSRRSDRELAKSIGVSQPTISRTLKKMQKDFGVTFTASADLAKAGFEIMAITFGKKEKSLWKSRRFRNISKNIVTASSLLQQAEVLAWIRID